MNITDENINNQKLVYNRSLSLYAPHSFFLYNLFRRPSQNTRFFSQDIAFHVWMINLLHK